MLQPLQIPMIVPSTKDRFTTECVMFLYRFDYTRVLDSGSATTDSDFHFKLKSSRCRLSPVHANFREECQGYASIITKNIHAYT